MRASLGLGCVCVLLLLGCGDDDGGGSPLDGGDDSGRMPTPDGSVGSGGQGGSGPDPAGSGGNTAAGSGGSGGSGAAGDGAVDPGDDGSVPIDSSTPPDEDAGTIDAGDGGGGSGDLSGPLDITYAAEGLGVDTRRCFAHDVGSDGTLASYTAAMGGIASPDEAPTRGTCEATDLFVDALSALGRLHDGTLGGEYYGNTVSFGANEGFHYAVVVRDEFLPTTGGSAYTFLAASDPTVDGGGATPGSVTGGAAIEHTPTGSQIALDLTVVVDSVSYHVETTGGTADPSTSQVSTYSGAFVGGQVALSNTDGVCSSGSSCAALLTGVIGGEDEERLAIAYTIVALPNAGGSGVQGVVLFER